MKLLNAIAGPFIVASILAMPAAYGAEPAKSHDMATMTHNVAGFMKACDMNHDGMVSKAEMMAHMEKMFDKMDKRKSGKLDRLQADAFLKELAKDSAGR